MKKLFTLVIATLAFTIAGNASTTTDVVTSPELPITFDESWSSSFEIQETNLKEGDIFTFTVEPVAAVSWTYGSQIFFKTNGWKDMPGTQTINVTSAGDYKLTLSAETVNEIKANGKMRVQGIDAKVTKVTLTTAEDYEETGTNVEFDQYGNILASAFEGLSDNDKIVFTYTTTGELTNDKGSIVGWGIGSIKSLKGNITVVNISATKVGDNDISILYKDLKPALEDEADEYNRQGINWNMWAQGNSTNTRKSVTIYKVKKGTATEINTVSTNKKTVDPNAPCFNLAGQRVSKSYKGIVVQNGRKFMNK